MPQSNPKSLHFTFYPLLLFFLLPSNGAAQPQSKEQSILLQLKQHWKNPKTLAHWTSSSASHCNWPEITCTNGSVTGISLPDYGIAGTVPGFICDLENLRLLDLQYDGITGGFPTVLYNCSRLEHLDLTYNALVGKLPGDIDRLAALRNLSLRDNNFTGTIPAALWRLGRLRSLSLTGTTFTGGFPQEVGNLSNLETLEMAYTSFAPSEIPASVFKLKNLKYLWISNANLIGDFPEAVGDLPALEHLDLSHNGLTGKIPSGLFMLRNLSFVYLYGNFLSGDVEIPPSMQALNLIRIDLGMNNLTGPIPEDFGKLEKLEYLGLFANQFSGPIPASIARLPAIQEIKLFTNRLTGPIPPDFGRYSPLVTFQASNNRLTGSLPEFLCDGGKLVGLVTFNNSLAGELPESLGNCSTLVVVMIYGNRHSGRVPAGLWSSHNLTTLMMSDNLLTGELPEKLAWNLSRLAMSNNRFSGEIPVGFPSQKSLVVLEASNNLFVGSIKKGLTALPVLTTLSLDGNQLSGEFPPEIISWESLTTLNLSRNRLSGEIPASVSGLLHLLYLDLSENHFSGQIPASLSNQRLIMLNLSSNNLGGRIPTGFDNSAYESSFLNNPALCSSNPSLKLNPCYYDRGRKAGRVSSHFVAVTFGIVGAVFALAFLISIFLIRARRRRNQGLGTTWKLTSFQRLSFKDTDILSSLTENNLIGSGGSGKVYKVVVNPSGDELVAVKKISSNSKLDRKLEKHFLAEVEILSTLRHSNIVKLLCCIHSDNSRLLVYEYQENRSLDLWLHGNKRATIAASAALVQRGALCWPKRLHIAVGAAQGLCYMHHHCSPPIVHRDVKSSNILLDSSFNARIADFGLARMLMKLGEPNTASVVQGSIGYMAPEFANTAKMNEKIDVYSFGVVLLELVTGREAGDGGEHGSLVEWAWCHIQQGSLITDAFDEGVEKACYLDEMTSVFKLGILCTKARPSARPSMREVLQVLLRCCNPFAYGVKSVKSEYEVSPLLKDSPRSPTENENFVSMV